MFTRPVCPSRRSHCKLHRRIVTVAVSSFVNKFLWNNCQQKQSLRFSDISVTETQTDTEMIDISKSHTETNTGKIFNTDTIYIRNDRVKN